MKRILSSGLILGLLLFPVAGLVGCGQESKTGTRDEGNDHDAGWDNHHDVGAPGQINRR